MCATDTSGSGVWVSLFEAQADSRDTRPYAIFIDVGDTGTGNQAPQADAGGPYEGEVGVPVQFDGSNSTDPDGIIVNRDWNFGDDSPVANGETPSHTYTEPGLYNVTHYVGDSSGATDADSTLVRITSPLCECDLNTDGTCTVLMKILVEDGIAAASRSTRRS